ncbi:MAG: 2-dehydropantoate 2-reductase N-terminal domain-containing protein [Clostridiaceae bacterium]|nr:2-dehydropantoate 2-reductase N-terminal domain-containing protein [Clostridiaceae bacterium]
MKVLIVGTGVIGTLYGKVLSEKNEVFHYVRDYKVKALDGKKIQFDIIDERINEGEITKGIYKYNCVNDTNRYDLIIVPVSSLQVLDTLRELNEKYPNSNFLIFTLLWDEINEINKILNKSQYILGYAGGGGTFKENLLWGNIGDDVMLGALYEEQQKLLKSISNLFKQTKISVNVPKNPLHWLWTHNVGASPMGAVLTRYENIQEFLDDKMIIKLCFSAMSEGYKICEKKGVKLKEECPESNMYEMEFEGLYKAFRNNFLFNPVMQRYTAHAFLAAKEMKYNFLKIYNDGKVLQVDMKSLDKMYEFIK